MLPRQAENSL